MDDFEERFRRLEREAEAEFAATKASRRAAEEAEHARKLAAASEQHALVRAREEGLEAAGEEVEDKPGFLARLFGRRMSASDAVDIVRDARGELDRPRAKKEKSLLWSGGLSLFFGPLGWLYAGSLRESIPASALYIGAAALLQMLPNVLLWPVMMVAMPVSGLIGVAYAWRHNKEGKRVRLLLDKSKQKQLSDRSTRR